MTARGLVREWYADDGWGVIDSPETPGGCWAHFSQVAMTGCRALSAGQVVHLDWEVARQDGFDYRAVRVTPLAGHLGPGPCRRAAVP